MKWVRKTVRVLGIVCATIILASAGLLFVSAPTSSEARREQYAVYSAYIEDGLTGDSHSLGDRRGTVLIAADSTMVAELSGIQRWRFMVGSLLNLRSEPSPPRLSLIHRLFVTNLRKHRFDRHFSISAKYELLDYSVLSSPNVHEQFPQSYGFLTFSSIAFNSDLTDALFYTEHICGLCGGGEYVVMHKTNRSWVVVSRYSTWVS